MSGEEAQINWLKNIKYSSESGHLDIEKLRITIFDSNVFRDYRESLAKIVGYSAADNILYLAGKRYAMDYIASIMETNLVANFAKRFSWGREKLKDRIADILTHYGYGNLKVVQWDPDGESVGVFKNSCIARSYKKKQDRPVCSYMTGILTGGMGGFMGRVPYEGKEVECLAMGDKACRIVVAREDRCKWKKV